MIAKIRRRLPPPVEGTVTLRIWHYDRNRGAQWVGRPIEAPPWADIAGNYPTRRDRRSTCSIACRHRSAPADSSCGTAFPAQVRRRPARVDRSWVPWCNAHYIADPERFFAESCYMTRVLTAPAADRTSRRPAAAGQARRRGDCSSPKTPTSICVRQRDATLAQASDGYSISPTASLGRG